MADRLVHLQRHLLGIEDDVHLARRALVRLEEGRRLLGNSRGLAFEAEPFHVLPASLTRRAGMRARVTPHLVHAVPDGHRVDPAAALDDLLLDLGAVRGEKELVLTDGAYRRLCHLDLRATQPVLGAQAEVDLLTQRDGERVALDRGAVGAALRDERGERALVASRRRAGEPARTERGGAGALRVQPPVAREAPGAANEDANTDPLALEVGEAVET